MFNYILRRILYLAFAVVALAFLAHGWNAMRLQDLGAADQTIVDRAASHATQAQEIGRLAASIAADAAERRGHAQALRELLATQAAQARELDALLAARPALGADPAAGVGQALQVWQQARERLWRRGGALLAQVEAGDGTDLLVIRDFANQHLGGAFTIFLVTRAEDPLFGACGNALNGNGGIPRLYLIRDGFTYHASTAHIGTVPNEPAILSYTHDGADAIAAWLNGTRAAAASGPEYAPVGSFGGGHWAIPFWCGNTYHGGAVAEVINLVMTELAKHFHGKPDRVLR